ncbi:hypothetical protein ACFS5N_05915 [Mucilaginibacter ximonensis]|uniref:Uncharacterized protein n=1 Tax=Mucilaginibacter ximonensis TaxID=538021 RepID=A0ABW5Y9M8_9SPHI
MKNKGFLSKAGPRLCLLFLLPIASCSVWRKEGSVATAVNYRVTVVAQPGENAAVQLADLAANGIVFLSTEPSVTTGLNNGPELQIVHVRLISESQRDKLPAALNTAGLMVRTIEREE